MKPWPLLGALAANAIPIYGVMALGWSMGSVMLLVAFEFLVSVVMMLLRVRWHKRRAADPAYAGRTLLARSAGTRDERTPGDSDDGASQWLIPAFVFLLIAGLAPIGFARKWPEQEALWLPRLGELGWPMIAIAASLSLVFLAELPTLARRSVASLRQQGEQVRWQAVSIAMTLIFAGVLVSQWQSPYAWLAVQVVFKLTLDVWLACQDRSRGSEPRIATLGH